MKKLLLFVLLFISVVANAQKGISYQAVILDPSKIEIPGQDISGQPFVNGNVNVKFVILSGTTSQFEEVQQTKTDAYGLVNLTIGSSASTAFNALTWDANQKSLQVFVSFNNGASYTKVSDQKLTYSPYALFSEAAGKLAGTLEIAYGGTGATTAAGARTNLGLGNVDNTSDAAKPISAATQTALNLKANVPDVNTALALKANTADVDLKASLASPTFTGTVSGITKSMVGLGSVDNTTDAAKPVSTAMQAALDLKANLVDVNTAIESKAPLASPAFSGNATAAGFKIPNGTSSQFLMADGSVSSSGSSIIDLTTSVAGVLPVAKGGTGVATLSNLKIDLAINNIDNTSDASKPISTSTQAALDLKASLESPTFTGIAQTPTPSTSDNSLKIANTTFVNNAITNASGNFVNLSTSQTIAGSKTFSNNITVYGVRVGTPTGPNNYTQNTMLGEGAFSFSSPGNNNTAIGVMTLSTLSAGGGNTAVGSNALRQAPSGAYGLGSNNTALGSLALSNGLSGNNNVAIGVSSMDVNDPGSNNTAVGYYSSVSGNATNSTAIGNGASNSTSNTIQLGNTSITNVKTSGTITAGVVTYPSVHGSNGQVLSTTGSGTLTWTTAASGLPSSGNTAGDMLYWNGSAWVKVAAGANGQTLAFASNTPFWTGTISYKNTVKSLTGRIWMDRNVGASSVATSATDANAYGDLFQWGRGADGHESRTAGETNIVSTSDTPGHGDFINQSSARWRSPSNLNLWQGVTGKNNVCPVGFRIPTKDEWAAELASWGGGSGFASVLKLPLGGHQHPTLSTPWQVGGGGSYWSSTPKDDLHSWNLGLSSTTSNMGIAQQGHGFSIRCIKD